MATKRKFTAVQKLSILREHLENQVPISRIAEEQNLAPSMIYNWKKQLFEGALETFKPGKTKAVERKIKILEDKLQHKDSLISELVSDNVRLKKNLRGEI